MTTRRKPAPQPRKVRISLTLLEAVDQEPEHYHKETDMEETTTAPATTSYRNPNATEQDRIAHDFGYHAPTTPEIAKRHEDIRAQCRQLAQWLAEKLPAGRERSLALTKVEEAGHWANAAIARTQQAP